MAAAGESAGCTCCCGMDISGYGMPSPLMLFYLKATYVEKQLMKKYPTYADYRRRTGRFFPKLL